MTRVRRALAVVLLSAVLGTLMGCAGRSSSESYDGVPYGGLVPWNSAVLESDGRTVHLLADWDHIDHFVCARPNERLTTSQSRSEVVVTVRGYAKPLPAGVACGGVGSPLQPFTIVLRRPLGTRRLVDGEAQASRRILRDAAVPTARSVPAGYTAEPMTWSFESSNQHTAARTWRRGGPSSDHFLRLTVGLPTTYYTFVGPAGALRGSATIAGSTAHIYGTDRLDQVVTTIRWTAASGQQRSLEAFGTDESHLSIDQIEDIASSVH